MAESSSIINLGDISKPATVLIEKVCNAVGVIYEPTQIKRKARAEVEAEKIRAVARIELSDIEHRALERLIHQESRKQQNIEDITLTAAKTLPLSANAQDIEEDWIAHFFKQCDTVSDKEMQILWSNLLAGEAAAPGTFSKRTVDFVSSIDKKDAELFTVLCQFIWTSEEKIPLIYDYRNPIYTNHGINFVSLKHLDSIGLISFEANGYSKTELKKQEKFSYFGNSIIIELPDSTDPDSTDPDFTENAISIGSVILTSIGEELMSICRVEPNMEFYSYVIDLWQGQNLSPSSPFNL